MILLTALLACTGSTAHPEPTPHGTWVDENLLLADGVARLLSFDECADLAPLPMARARTGEVIEEVPFWGRTWALPDGSALVMVATSCGGAVTDRYALVRGGSLVPLGRPASPLYGTTPDPRGVAVGGGLLLVDCDAGVSMWADPAGSLAAVDSSAMCARAGDAWTAGESTQGRVAFVTVSGGAIEASAWALSQGVLVEDAAAAVTLGAGDRDRPLWVEEIAYGSYAWLVDSATFGDVRYASSDDAAAIAVGPAHPGGAHPPLAFRDGADLIVALASGEGELSTARVSPLAGAVTPEDAAAPEVTLPLARHAWFGLGALLTTATDPTADDESLDSPVELDLRGLQGAAITSTTPASTPCAERWHCREVGESHLVAVAGDLGFYGMWDWYGYGAVFVAPIQRPPN